MLVFPASKMQHSSAVGRLQVSLTKHVVVHRSENEKNRRRDLITALVSRREQMLLSLKRDHSSQQRCARRTSLVWCCAARGSIPKHCTTSVLTTQG